MAQTLRTGDFSLRALPQMPRLNPADFDAGIGDILALFERGMQLPAKLEQVRATQRQGRLERATEPQRLELAQRQGAANLELLPFEVASKKEQATRSLDQPGGDALYYDEQGNLVQEKVTIETDPVTGEQFNISVPSIIKTAEQVRAERESTAALAQMRLGNVAAAQQRADAAETSAGALANYRNAQAAALAKGGKGRTVTVPIPGPRGRQAGSMEIQYDGSGRTIRRTFIPAVTIDPVTRQPNNPEPVDLPLDEAIDDGASPDQSSAPATSPALPVSNAPTGQSPAPLAPVSPVAQQAPQPNDAQLKLLRSNPSLAPQFDAMFGPGAAARILGGN